MDLRPQARVPSVEYARGVAALAVVWFHFTNGHLGFLQDGWLKFSGSYGYLGVQVFFVISGFVIPYSLNAGSYDWRRSGVVFLVRRLVRLEPPYLISCVLIITLNEISSLTPGFLGPPPQHVLYDFAWHPLYLAPWVGVPWLNPVYWTLAIEFQYYLFALVVAPALLSSSITANRAALALTLALSFASSDPRLLIPYLPIFVVGFVIFLGMKRSIRPLEQIAWIGVALLCTFHHFDSAIATAAAVGAALIVAPWPGNIRWLMFLGSVSYSLYLLHVPVGGRIINLASRLPANELLRAAAMAVALALSVAAAYLFWRFVERPAVNASRRVAALRLGV